MIGSEAMARITQQVMAGIDGPPNEPPEDKEYREETIAWVERMRRDAKIRGLELKVEIPNEWPEPF
jgi:hypothetical protein